MTVNNHRVEAPAAFVPSYALAYGALGEAATAVDADHPLPVENRVAAAQSTPLTGNTGSSIVAGPFVPVLGRAIWITFSGSWTGKVTVKRSVNGGVTKLPLTLAGGEWGAYTANANEVVGEESVAGASWYLDIALSGGTLTYAVQQ